MDADIIDERLLFYGFFEFFRNRIVIKSIFQTKSRRDQLIYKWYLYSRPFISETAKNFMWDYLQSDISDFDFIRAYRLCIRKR